MIRLEYRVAQSGFAAGKAFVIRPEGAGESRVGDPAGEGARLEAAAAELNRRLAARRENGGPEERAVLEAEILMLNGEEFLGAARKAIREKGLGAAEAVRQAADRVCGMLADSGQEYLRGRQEDIRGLAAGLKALMDGGMAVPSEPSVLVGRELSPGQITMIGPERILGILTEVGSASSHVSVLAGGYGIPCLYGMEGLMEKVRDGDLLILDPEEAGVIVNPTAEQIREAEEKRKRIREIREQERKQSAGKATRTRICANISRAEEADGLPEKGADGIGLFRSELLFLNGAAAPSEEEQFEAYRHAAEAMQGRETVIRTMDIGSDKHAAWMEMPEENNPALGLRGLRVSLKYRELFRTQLRALLRAAACGSLRIMAPMVASVWELEEVEKEIRAAAEELERRGESYRIPELGVMIETPAAVMIAPELAGRARFFSIGTNDLTQYTLAADRDARGMEDYSDPMHEAVMRMISMTVEAAHEKKIPVAVCGELAGNPRGLERLIRLGVDELSVAPAKLASVREQAVRVEESMTEEKEPEKDKAEGKEPGREKPGDGGKNKREPGHREGNRKEPGNPGEHGREDEAPGSCRGEPRNRQEHKKEGIRSPVEGELIPMEEIPDPVFSGGVIGECVGVMPDSGRIVAPVSGTVTTVAATGHAVSLRADNGEEILVHAGLDTVRLRGEGFRMLVREGQRVTQGELILEADLELIRSRGFSPMIVVVRVGSSAPTLR